jgi:glycosyltransferase involved in cell wall biosynthesis
MSANISLSIVICTCNRAESLRQTMNSLGKVKVPAGCRAELIIVDNASTDSTATVAQNAGLENMQTIYLFEPRKGKSNALNSALAIARGETLVFTDDDVVPSEDWIEQILHCFHQTQCDALVGKVELAPHLDRSWMRKLEKYYLAITYFESGTPIHWVGANAAFQRRCLQRVRRFDPELGSGALGNSEDTLFGRQLVEAGFKMEYAGRAIVVHQPDKSRLARRAWLHAACLRARSEAYILHHWEHVEIKKAALRSLWFLTKLKLRSLLQPPPPLNSEGCPRWEWSHVYNLAFYRQYCIERRRPRNYARHGLEKLDVSKAPVAIAATRANPVGYRQHSGV